MISGMKPIKWLRYLKLHQQAVALHRVAPNKSSHKNYNNNNKVALQQAAPTMKSSYKYYNNTYKELYEWLKEHPRLFQMDTHTSQ